LYLNVCYIFKIFLFWCKARVSLGGAWQNLTVPISPDLLLQK
jgi:hypothetical protein